MMKKIHQKLKMIYQKKILYEIESHLVDGEKNEKEDKLLATNVEVKVVKQKLKGS